MDSNKHNSISFKFFHKFVDVSIFPLFVLIDIFRSEISLLLNLLDILLILLIFTFFWVSWSFSDTLKYFWRAYLDKDMFLYPFQTTVFWIFLG